MNMFGNSTLMQTAPKVSGGGTGGTSDYNDLGNKPSIDGVTLEGNKTLDDLGIQEKVDGKGLSTNDYTNAEKTKLSGIAASANNYVHPSKHPASVITQDANNRFVTDTEKSSWNNKADKSTTINGKSLTSNVTLTQDDIKNGSSFKQFGNEDKIKLDSIVIGTSGNINEDITAHNADVDAHPRLKDMVTLDNETKENFNFIGNKVVPDGLIRDYETITNFKIPKKIPFLDNGQDFNLMFFNGITWADSGTGLTTLILFNVKYDMRYYYVGGKYLIKVWIDNVCDKAVNLGDKPLYFGILRKNTSYYLYTDKTIEFLGTGSASFNGFDLFHPSTTLIGSIDIAIYNRPLTQTEIAHNFSVLNNSPSLKSLETTATDGKKTTILFGADENTVEMRSGRTLAQEYMGVLKTLGKEHVSTNGADISVANGVEARVIGAEIVGQTVKNVLKELNQMNVNNNSIAGQYSVNLSQTLTNQQITIKAKISNIDTSNGSLLCPAFLCNGKVIYFKTGGEDIRPFITDGIYTGLVTIASDRYLDDTSLIYKPPVSTANCTIDWLCLFDGDISVKTVSSYVPFGLSSTEACISNNGIKYPFYEPVIQGLTKIVDANGNECVAGTQGARLVSLEATDSSLPKLGSTPSIADTIDFGSGIITDNNYKLTFNGTEDWKVSEIQTNTTSYSLGGTTTIGTTSLMSNKFITKFGVGADEECVYSLASGVGVYVRVSRNKANNLAEFIQWLKNEFANGTPLQMNVVRKTPQQIQLTPDQVKAYDAHKKQILLGGVGGVNDKLTLNADGSLSGAKEFDTHTITDTTPMMLVNGDLSNFLAITLNSKPNGKIMCDKIINNIIGISNDNLGLEITGDGKIRIRLWTGKDKTLDDYKQAIKGFVLMHQLATPTTYTVDKAVNEPIATTDKINIFSVGEAVKPSSFKVNVPVNTMAEMDKLKADMANVTALVNEMALK